MVPHRGSSQLQYVKTKQMCSLQLHERENGVQNDTEHNHILFIN